MPDTVHRESRMRVLERRLATVSRCGRGVPPPPPSPPQPSMEPHTDLDLLDRLAASLYLREEPAAKDIAELAWRRCSPATSPLTKVRLLANLGRIYVLLHNWGAAARALERARTVLRRHPWPIGDAKIYSDLAVVYLALGDAERARSSAAAALRAHRVAGNEVSAVRASNNLGLASARAGRVAEAESILAGSLASCNRLGIEAGRGHLLLTIAEVNLAGGDVPGAGRMAAEAAAVCESLGERLTLAAAYEWLGRIAAHSGLARDADRYFGDALDLLDELGAQHRRVECLASHGRMLELRGDLRQALTRYRQAALAAGPRGLSCPGRCEVTPGDWCVAFSVSRGYRP